MIVVSHTGDVEIPTEGSRVLIAYRPNERAVVIGQRYQKGDSVPPYKPGERVIGHPTTDSTIRMNEDGSVTITNDAESTITLQKDGAITCETTDKHGFKISADGKITIAGTEVDIYTDGTTL